MTMKPHPGSIMPEAKEPPNMEEYYSNLAQKYTTLAALKPQVLAENKLKEQLDRKTEELNAAQTSLTKSQSATEKINNIPCFLPEVQDKVATTKPIL